MYTGGKNITGSGIRSNFRGKFKIPNMALLKNTQYVCSYIQTCSEHSDEEKMLFILFRSVPKFT